MELSANEYPGTETLLYGIIGYPLGHSFSPAYFKEKFSKEHIPAAYLPFPIRKIQDFPGLISAHPALRGLNVTLPYKKAILPYLDALDDSAQATGAVNCILIRDKLKKGYNTDTCGFQKSLEPLLQAHHRRALVLGTGGASLAVGHVLQKLRIPYDTVSRKPAEGHLTYRQITPELIEDYPLIVQTTPLGMYPDTDTCPDIPYEALGSRHLLYDLVYHPQETRFLKKGKAAGAAVKNGLEMLYLQAEASWQIWQEAV